MTTPTYDDSADIVALWRLQSTYADVVTRRAWGELATVFRPDVAIVVDTVTAEPIHLNGPEEFAAFVGPATDHFDHFEFVILNTVVEVDGSDHDKARGRIFMCEIRRAVDGGSWSTAYGLYQDTYTRVDGVWWIAERRYRSLARTGAAEGVFGIPDGMDLFRR